MAETIKSINLIDIVPPNLRKDLKVIAAAKAIDKELKLVTEVTKECMHLSRLYELPEAILDLLAWQWHVDFYEPIGLSIARKRNLIRQSIAWHRIKGTPAAIEEVVKATYGNCTLTEWFEYGGKPYFFRVAVTLEEESTDKNRWKNVIAAINSAKNTRSWLEDILFYYPTINMPIKIRHSAKSMQYVRADHCIWNLGSARSTYWDDEFYFDDTIRFDGIYPNDLYRERQLHTVKMTGLVNAYMQIKIIHAPIPTALVNARQTITIEHQPKVTQRVGITQKVEITNSAKSISKSNIEQSTSCCYTNMFDDSFCFDDSHFFDDRQENTTMINHACTVRTLKKDGTEGARETV